MVTSKASNASPRRPREGQATPLQVAAPAELKKTISTRRNGMPSGAPPANQGAAATISASVSHGTAPRAKHPDPVPAKVGAAHTPEDRYRMIRDAAFFRAERRGFDGGDPVQDWLEAETEIDRMLAGSHGS